MKCVEAGQALFSRASGSFDFAEKDANRYRDLTGMGGAPGDDLFNFERVVRHGCDGNHVLLNLFRVSHAGISMAQERPLK
jgi:hypothetical protein